MNLIKKNSYRLWAYYKQSQAKGDKEIFIPILNIPKKELKLRKDAVHLYQQIDKSLIDNFFFLDTIPLNKILSFTSSTSCNSDDKKENECKASLKLNVHLVDHNNLSIILNPEIGEFVNFIIDHHKDEGNYTKVCNDKNGNRIIDIAGSNVSIIINYILSLNKDFDFSKIESEFGPLITSVILLDTGGFNKDLGKTTDSDIKVYKLFEKYSVLSFEKLLALRNNVDGFDFADLLMKDFKVFQENEVIFGIPGFGDSINNWHKIENDELFKKIHSFQIEKQLHIIPLMTIFSNPENNKLQRELALFSNDETLFNKVCDSLQTEENKAYLGLNCFQNKDKYKVNDNNIIHYQYWRLGLQISRKKLVPLLRKILKAKL